MKTFALLAAALLAASPVKAGSIDYTDPLMLSVAGVLFANGCNVPVPETEKKRLVRMMASVYGERALGITETIRLDVETKFSNFDLATRTEICGRIAGLYEGIK